MQLIRITSTPIKYQIEIEPARLEMKQAQNARQQMTHEPSQLKMQSRNIQVRLDTTDLRASLNLRTSREFARYYASRGMQSAYEAIGDAVTFGNQMERIYDGVTISQIVRQRMLEQPTTYTTFIPSERTDISWQPQELQLDYDPGSLQFDWQVMRNQMEYIPGRFRMNITQYPKVQVEYLGTPNYVPPSADPNYEGTTA